MAKLYWRVKKNGKWTWCAAHDCPTDSELPYVKVLKPEYDSSFDWMSEEEE